MGRMKELSNNFKKDKQVNFRRDNFTDMAAAVEYTDEMLSVLCQDLIAVDESSIKAYSKLTEIPINIQAVPEEMYLSHLKKGMEIKSRIAAAIKYLNDIDADITEYLKSYDYESKLRDDITADIDKELIKYLDNNVPEVIVQYNDDAISSSYPDVTLLKAGVKGSYKFMD